MSYLNRLAMSCSESATLTPWYACGKRAWKMSAGNGPEAEFVGRHLTGQAQRQQGAAVITAAEGDHAGAFGIGSGDLDGILDRFRTGGDEQGHSALPSIGARLLSCSASSM